MGPQKFPFNKMPARAHISPRAVLSSTVELMRENAIFEVPDPEKDNGMARVIDEDSRERQWEFETLQLFRRRTVLITTASMMSLPFFWLIFSSFAPAMRWQIAAAHLIMFSCCMALHLAARRVTHLGWMRAISASAYFVYGMTASLVMWLASELRVTTFSGHEHILLSMLLVPFALPEAILCVFAVAGTYAISLYFALPDELQFTLIGHIFSMFFLGMLIVFLIALQNQARRRAFDVSFDMAISANRGASLSTLDEVTGGYNRRHLMNMLELEMARMRRFEQSLGVIMFDLDNFKRVNDTNGHVAGDEVLRQILTSASDTLRGIDTIARYGGDEFVILLPNTGADGVSLIADRVRSRVSDGLQDSFPPNSLESLVTLSLGAVSIDCRSNLCSEDVLECADSQLYKAKRAGKDQVCVG